MNGTYYQNPTFPASIDNNYQETNIIKKSNSNTITDLLKNNIGKRVNVFYSEKEFIGIIENIQDELIIISNPETGNWYLLLTKYLYYIEFEETINL